MNGLLAKYLTPILLAVGITLAAALVGGGYWLGAGLERGRAAERDRDASRLAHAGTQHAIALARANATAEAERRAETALRHARADALARGVKQRGISDAMQNNRAGCGLPDSAFGLLNEAIDAANGTPRTAPAPAERVPAGLP